MLWTRYFMEVKGYRIQEIIVYQDSNCAILMEKNCKALRSKRMNHINITRYYFLITYWISKKDLMVEWCPTGDMIGD